jgi:hypothetical protein
MTFRLLSAHSAATGCDARAKVVTAVMMDTFAFAMSIAYEKHTSLPNFANSPKSILGSNHETGNRDRPSGYEAQFT